MKEVTRSMQTASQSGQRKMERVSAVIYSIFVCSFGALAWFKLLDNQVPVGGTCAGVALFVGLLMRPGVLESLEGLGLKAKWQAKVDEATNIVKELRLLLTDVVRFSVDDAAKKPWIFYSDRQAGIQRLETMVDHLNSIGVGKDAILSVRLPLVAMSAHEILNHLVKIVNFRIDELNRNSGLNGQHMEHVRYSSRVFFENRDISVLVEEIYRLRRDNPLTGADCARVNRVLDLLIPTMKEQLSGVWNPEALKDVWDPDIDVSSEQLALKFFE